MPFINMNKITNRSLIKTCQTMLRLHTASRLGLVMRSPVIVSNKRSKSDASEEEHPIQFSKSTAFDHKPVMQFVGRSSGNRPGVEMISIYVSFVVASLYLYYREENDLDEQFSKTLDEALEHHGFNADNSKK